MSRVLKVLEAKICVICGKEFQPKYCQAICCSHNCSAVNYERKRYIKSISRPTVAEVKAKTKKVTLITDEEQSKIDKEIAEKKKVNLQPCFSYIPGTPAFEKAVFETYLNHKLF